MQTNKPALIGTILLIVLVVFAFKAGTISIGGSQTSQTAQAQNVNLASPSPAVLEVGQKAPDFRLTDVDGKVFPLKSLSGKPVILFGMASWCGECIKEGRDLTKLQQIYGDKIQVIGIAFTSGDTTATIKQFKQIGSVNIPLALDTDNVAQKYHLVNLDSTYFIDKQGILAFKSESALSYSDIQKELGKIL